MAESCTIGIKLHTESHKYPWGQIGFFCRKITDGIDRKSAHTHLREQIFLTVLPGNF